MLFTHDATEYAQAIKAGQLSVTELTTAAIQTIKAQNPHLNAVTSLQEKEALALAHAYDDRLTSLSDQDRQSLPPFFGVPILLKDLGQNQAGFPSTGGAALFKDLIASTTDYFVQAVLDCGFIVVGRTNTPEFGFKNISDARLHGPVTSPLDAHRNPGGSSGGAAAALKAGWVPLTTASDGGGSIRIPASFTGLIGLKPSRGRIPVGPHGYRSWQGSAVNFALTKSIRDTWTLLKALQVEQREAPFSLPVIPEETLNLPDRSLTIAYSTRTLFDQYAMPADTLDRLMETVAILKDLGHTLVEADPAVDGQRMMESYYIISAGVETAAMMKAIEQGMGRPLQPEDMEAMSWMCYQYGLSIPGYLMSQTLDYWDQLGVTMEAFYQNYDLWLTPATNGPAPLQDQFLLSPAFIEKLITSQEVGMEARKQLIWEMFDQSLAWTPYTQLMNLTGQPAISLPIRSKEAGLPIGMQVAAARGQEYRLLSLGLQLEQAGYLDTTIAAITTP